MAMRAVSANIAPNEILFPDSPIMVEISGALQSRSAQSGIVVQDVQGQVRLSRRGSRARWLPKADLPPGHHLLIVGGLLTEKSRPIGDDLAIPFFVTDSVAKVPRTVRIESMSRLRLQDLQIERLPSDRRPAGKYIEIMKAAHRKTGKPMTLAFDEKGRKVDSGHLLQRVVEKRVRAYGKLHETLHRQLEKAGVRTRIPVALWLNCAEAHETDEKKVRGQTVKPPRRLLARRRAVAEVASSFIRRMERHCDTGGVHADTLAPVVYAELTRQEIQSLAKEKDVVGIFLHETGGIEDLGNSMAIANSDDVQASGTKGSGIKVAVWEDGPDVTTNLSITARYLSSGFSTSQHARHTHGIVKNIESRKPHGHAASCALHSANSKDLDALRWAAKDKACTVISQSFHRSSEPGSATMSYDDIYKDWLALQWPYPTICQAAGNYWNGDPDGIDPPSSEYVNHKGYNGLTVGNHDDNAAAMSGDSVFRNPSSLHGDRELPEIAANGTSVTTVGLTMSGTSMASPAAAGCVALVQNTDSTLKSWPEGCRAIMLAGAKRNVAGHTWWQDVTAHVDAADGTGAVDALESVNIAKQRRSRNAAATQRGWDIGTLRSSDIGSNRRTKFSYSVRVPSSVFGPRHVKVALAWDSKITSFSIFGIPILLSTLAVDLALQVFDSRGNQVGYSGSWDNSYEIAEFQGRPGETYTIKIRRWSGTDDVWYGIAWTVTGGLFWADVTRATVLEEMVTARRRR